MFRLKNLNFNHIIVWLFWLALGYIVLSYYNPINAVSNKPKEIVFKLFPQGWGFFTRDPKDKVIGLFQIQREGFKLVSYNNGAAENLFGLSKKARYNMIEVSSLAQQLKDSKNWKEGKGDPKRIFNKLKITDTIVPEKKNLVVTSGNYIIVETKPIPFAWGNQKQKDFQPYKVIKVHVK